MNSNIRNQMSYFHAKKKLTLWKLNSPHFILSKSNYLC